MDYKLIKEKNNKVKITFELGKEEWEKEIENAYNKNKGKYNLQGFRKGKAPRKAIENAYGSGVFMEDALDEFCDKAYKEVLDKEQDFEPIDHPTLSVDKFDENGLSITMVVDVVPEIKLGNYTGLEIDGVDPTFDSKHIEEHIKHMAEKNVRIEEIKDRVVQNDDFVTLDFSGSVDGKKFDGGTSTNYVLHIGSNTFIEGFEPQIIGMNIGEEKDINVTFPKDYNSKELAGKDAVFAIKVHKIEQHILPEINDEWASNASEFDTLEELKKDIETKEIEHAKKHADNENENKLIEKIVENASVEIPESMVNRELEAIIQDFESKLAYQGLKLADYVKYIGITEADFRENTKQEAQKRVKVQLVLSEIIKIEKIDATDEEVETKLDEMGKKYGKSVDEIKKMLPAGQVKYLKNEIIMDKLISYLKENNKILVK